MDPSIMKMKKLLEEEEDEDETMHCGADVEAFTAALNRDIEDHISPCHSHSVTESDKTQTPYDKSQYQRLHNMSNQQEMAPDRAPNAINHIHVQVPFKDKVSFIKPQLDKDRAMQVQALDVQREQKKIFKETFVQHMKDLVGDQMLKMADYKLRWKAAQNLPNASKQFPLSAKTSAQDLQMAIRNTSHVPSLTAQFSADSSNMVMDNGGQTSRGGERHSDSHGNVASQLFSSNLSAVKQERDCTFQMRGLSKLQQQPYSCTNISTSAQSKLLAHDLQTNQVPGHPSIGASQIRSATRAMNQQSVPKVERQNSLSYVKSLQGGTFTQLTNNPALQYSSVHQKSFTFKEQNHLSYVKQEPIYQTIEKQQGSKFSTSKDEAFESCRMGFSKLDQKRQNSKLSSQIPSTISPLVLGSKRKVGQKNPSEAHGSPHSLASKKQKVAGEFLNQSIEQLNDVTFISGVNLSEEEEQLFSGSKEESKASIASRRFVQEEEERLILNKIPLQKKLEEIMAKCGVSGISDDVERCLSLCVEERLRGLIGNLIRMSRQRADLEKPRHQTIVTSDVWQQIMIMNQKAREEWEKKQGDAEELQRIDDPEDNTKADGDNDSREISPKANRECYDIMRATAANVAARAAVGGDDIMLKWQLMADQARQKNRVQASTSQTLPNSTENVRGNQDANKRNMSPALLTPGGSIKKSGRNKQDVSPIRRGRSIWIKDVVSVLEREVQMSKSLTIYSLYDKIPCSSNTC